jgi:hypothetical protein
VRECLPPVDRRVPAELGALDGEKEDLEHARKGTSVVWKCVSVAWKRVSLATNRRNWFGGAARPRLVGGERARPERELRSGRAPVPKPGLRGGRRRRSLCLQLVEFGSSRPWWTREASRVSRDRDRLCVAHCAHGHPDTSAHEDVPAEDPHRRRWPWAGRRRVLIQPTSLG